VTDHRSEHELVEEITRRVLERLRDDRPGVAFRGPSSVSQGAALAPHAAAFVSDEGRCEPCTVWGHCAEKCPSLFRAFVDFGACRISARPGVVHHPRDLAPFIDHTLLKPDATQAQVEALCRDAREHSFASVCVNGVWVALARRNLAGSCVRVCAVVGFPLGAMHPDVKAAEARRAVLDGADEIDMVLQVGALKSGDYRLVERDIRGVVDASHPRASVKVILETVLLTRDEKVKACTLAKAAGADFVKTSTGFAAAGATVEDVKLMREAVGESMGVKAAGGIRDTETAMAMIAAGATRIGASASVAIVKDPGRGSKSAPAQSAASPALPATY
jgi:deoxyribose-phosphate aldolase